MNGPTNDVSKGHRMNRFLALFAFVVFAIFVGILAFNFVHGARLHADFDAVALYMLPPVNR